MDRALQKVLDAMLAQILWQNLMDKHGFVEGSIIEDRCHDAQVADLAELLKRLVGLRKSVLQVGEQLLTKSIAIW